MNMNDMTSFSKKRMLWQKLFKKGNEGNIFLTRKWNDYFSHINHGRIYIVYVILVLTIKLGCKNIFKSFNPLKYVIDASVVFLSIYVKITFHPNTKYQNSNSKIY